MTLMEVLSLNNFISNFKDEKVNFQLAYKFYKIQSFLSDCQNFYKDNLNQIIEKYGIKEEDSYKTSEDGQSILIQEGKELECARKVSELENTKIDISSIKLFEEKDFEEFDLTFEQGILLANLIKE